MKIVYSLLALALLASPAVSAAQSANPVMNSLRQREQRYSRIMVSAAELMPANKYGYHSTPAQMTFGHLIVHITGANNMMCAIIGGKKMPPRPKVTNTSPKAELVAAIKASFAYCDQALAGATDAQLGEMVPFFGGRKVPRAAMVLEAAGDWADHYGQQAYMLRMNGILPPTARHGKM